MTKMSALFAGAAFMGGSMMVTGVLASQAAPTTLLDNVVQQLRVQYPDVQNITADDLEARREENILLLDIRRAEEFAVSHLEGAIHVSPGMKTADLIALFGPELEGRAIVFYCSVGARSSRFARRTTKALIDAGAGEIYNLEGGIFGWHNDKRPLVSNGEPTDAVHSYNRRWGRLLKNSTGTAD